MKKSVSNIFILTTLFSSWLVLECESQSKTCMLDLGIILDESASIWSVYFEQVKRMAVKMVELLQPSVDGSHISIMTFSSDAKMVFNFRDPEAVNPSLGSDKIWSIVQGAGSQTCTDLALKKANEEMFNTGQIRQGVTQILIYFSDGQSNCASYNDLMQLAEILKKRDIIVLTLGVGTDVSEKEMSEISTDGKNYFHAVDYDKAIQSVNTLLERSCKYAEVNTPVAPASLIQVEDESLVTDTSLVVDFGVIIDINLWVNENFFEFVKMIPAYLMKFLGVSQSGIRVAAIYFSREARFLYKFDSAESYNVEAATRLISTVLKSDSPEICSEAALQMAHEEMFVKLSGRENVPKILLYVSAGFTSCKGMEEEWKWVQLLKQMGITIFSLGIGDRVDTYEMSMIASGGSNYFHISSYAEIKVALKQIVLASLNYASSGVLKINYQTSSVDFEDDKTLLALEHKVACGFVMDESAYASADVFRMMRAFMIQMSKYLKIAQGVSKTSAVFFSLEPRFIWGFDWPEANDMTATLRKLYSLEQRTEKRSCGEKALDEVSRNMFKNAASNGLAKVLIFLTASSNDCGGLEEMRKNSLSIQAQNVLVFSVGFSSDIRITEMQAVASTEENYIAVNTWSQVAGSIRTVIELITKYEPVAIITPITKPDAPSTTQLSDSSSALDTNIVTPGQTNVFDIGIIIDESGGFSNQKFMITLDFITKIMTKFSTQIGGTRISVMTFAMQARILWKFSDSQSVDPRAASQFIRSFEKSTDSQVCSEQALKMASLDMFNQRFHRNGVKKFLMFITADENNCGGMDQISQFAKELKERGIAILSFGIGHSINLNELIMISTARELVYEYKTVEEFYSSLDIIFSTINNFRIELYSSKDTNTAIEAIPEVVTPKVPTHVKAYGKLDLVIIIDDSISTSTGDFENMKEMIIKIIELTGISVEGTRVSVIYFSKGVRVIWSLMSPESSDLTTARKTLYEVQQTKDSFTCIGMALLTAYDEIRNNGRQGVQKAVIIFTDGQENCGQEGNVVTDAITKIKSLRTSVIAVGIGQNIHMEDLKLIANPSSNAVEVTRFSEVLTLIEQLLVMTSKTVISEQTQKICPDCPHDIGIMFDGGSLYFEGQFVSLKHYVSAIFQSIFQQSTNSKVSVGVFEKHARVLWSFNAKEATDLDSVISFFATVPQSEEKLLCMKPALNTALDVMFASEAVRKDSVKSLILIIGGSDNCDSSESIREMANNLQLRGIEIFVIMIGSSPEMFDPKLISSSSESSFYYADLHAAFDARVRLIQVILTHIRAPTPGNLAVTTDVKPPDSPVPIPQVINEPEPPILPPDVPVPVEPKPEEPKPSIDVKPNPIDPTVEDPIPDVKDISDSPDPVPNTPSDLPVIPSEPPIPTPPTSPHQVVVPQDPSSSISPPDVPAPTPPDIPLPPFSSPDTIPPPLPHPSDLPDLPFTPPDVPPSPVSPQIVPLRKPLTRPSKKPSKPVKHKPSPLEDVTELPFIPEVVTKRPRRPTGRRIAPPQIPNEPYSPRLPPQPPMHVDIPLPPPPSEPKPLTFTYTPTPLATVAPNIFINVPSPLPPLPPPPPVLNSFTNPPMPQPIQQSLLPPKIEIHMPPAPPPVVAPPPQAMMGYSPRLTVNPIMVVLKACPQLPIQRVGCFPAIYKGFFDTRIAKPFCQFANTCSLNKAILSKLICHCAAKAKKHGIKVFAVTKKGSCIGSAHQDAVMKRLRTALTTCRSEIGYQCSHVDEVCIGGPESMFIYKL